MSDCNCDPLAQTGGGHAYTCPEFEPECTCYELIGGHQQGCAFYGGAAKTQECIACDAGGRVWTDWGWHYCRVCNGTRRVEKERA